MKNILAKLSVRQRISIGAVMLLVILGVCTLVRRQREADFKPLFTGVSAEDAAAIVQKVKEAGVEYRLPEGGGAVLVPSAKVAELRLNLAAAGLPKTGRIGFELFDKANLGATEFAEHVNYRRALEGELERSVMAMAEVEQARVHLTFPKDSVFLDAQQPAKASVLIKTRPGAKVSRKNVVAINHLVASAVEGLSPDAVSVLDMNGNLLGRPKPASSPDAEEASEESIEYRRKIEADLLAKVNSTLEPLLGANRFRASVSVECDFTGAEQSEEVFDPTRSVMVTSQRTEDASAVATSNGVPGTASALPRPTSRPGSNSKGISRVTENVTYQTSRMVKKTRLPAGNIRKMSLAVLVDQDVTWERDRAGYKRVLAPPSAATLKVLRDVVSGITGFNAERGDQLVVETLPFETTLATEPPPFPPSSPSAQTKTGPGGIPLPAVHWDAKTIGIAAAAAVGLLVLVLAGLRARRLLHRAKDRKGAVAAPAELPAGAPTAAAIAPEGTSTAVSTQQEGGKDGAAKLAEAEELEKKAELAALGALKLNPVITKTAEVLAKHLREKITKDPEIAAHVLRTWVREEEEG